MAIETDPGLGELIEKGSRVTFVAICAHLAGAERVDEHEEDIQIRPIPQRQDDLAVVRNLDPDLLQRQACLVDQAEGIALPDNRTEFLGSSAGHRPLPLRLERLGPGGPQEIKNFSEREKSLH